MAEILGDAPRLEPPAVPTAALTDPGDGQDGAEQHQLERRERPLPLAADERQVGQLLLNLLKNAAEAMEPLAPDAPREITLRLVTTAEALQLVLEDTGPGFPPDKIERLTEPYVTTRAKGTGLGLAIVKRSMEEHKGSIMLANRSGGGAQVTLSFSRRLTPG